VNVATNCVGKIKNDVPAPPVADVEEAVGTTAVVVGADIDGIPPVVPAKEGELTGTAGVAGAICPTGEAQVRAVPGIVGSDASGTGARVVSGAAWVNAENGLGPLSGEDCIAPGVV
jgi:hypothetical protein